MTVTSRQKQFHDAGIGWMGRMIIAEGLFDFGEHDDFRIILEDTSPRQFEATLQDPKVGAEQHIIVTCR